MVTNLIVALSCDCTVEVACHANAFDFRPNFLCDARLILRVNWHTVVTIQCLVNTHLELGITANIAGDLH